MADSIGGAGSYAVELSRALATMGPPLSRRQQAEVGLVPNAELFENIYKLEWMNQPRDDVDAVLRRLIEDIPIAAIKQADAGKQSLSKRPCAGSDELPVLLPKGIPCAS